MAFEIGDTVYTYEFDEATDFKILEGTVIKVGVKVQSIPNTILVTLLLGPSYSALKDVRFVYLTYEECALQIAMMKTRLAGLRLR